MYTYENPEQVFGSFGAAGDWWEALDYETKVNVQNWIAEKAAEFGVPINASEMQAAARAALRASGIESPRITAEMIASRVLRMILEGYARPVADGGGFAVYEPATGVNHCMCVTSPGSAVPTAQVADGRCPAGTGGVPTSQPTAVSVGRKPGMKTFVKTPKPPGSDVRTATIKGRVVDAAGVGIVGASVVVSPGDGGAVGAGMSASVATGPDGGFSADVVPRGGSSTLSVSAEAAGYVGVTASGVAAVKGQITEGLVIPLAAASASDGFVEGGGGGDGGDGGGGAGTYCPEGFVMASDGVSCVALGEKSDAASKPWYRKTSTWMIVGGVVIVGAGIAIGWPRRRR